MHRIGTSERPDLQLAVIVGAGALARPSRGAWR
jgi:hypothetical protein